MKKIIKIMIIVLLIGVIILYKIYDSHKNTDYTDRPTTDNTIELTRDEVNNYFDIIVSITNDPSNIDNELKDNNLISSTLYDSTKVLIEENNNKEVPGSTYSDIDVYDYSRTEITNGEYPVIDIYGNTYKYGTKEESDKSFEVYRQQENYLIRSYEINKDTLRIKYIDRYSMEAYIVDIKLDNDKKIISYKFI